MRQAVAFAFACGITAAAGCGGGPTMHTLAQPAYIWGREHGLCGRTVAMDRDGVLWAEAGCENPDTRYSRIRALPAVERAAVVAAFTSVADAAPAEVASDCPLVHQLIVMKPDGGYAEWRACATAGTDADPTAGLAEPYAAAIRALPIK